MLVSSRSFAGYLAMFDLVAADLAGQRVLDVAAGAADFNAVASRIGAHAIAVDAAYSRGRHELAQQVADSVTRGLTIVDQQPERFTWAWYGDRATRDTMRHESRVQFTIDLDRGPARYVAGELPRLPFRHLAADLVLCSHLLFTWAEQFDLDWHVTAAAELARVGREVRIFPTVVQGSGAPIPWLPKLVAQLERRGIRAERRRVPYEFQVGANEMLVLLG